MINLKTNHEHLKVFLPDAKTGMPHDAAVAHALLRAIEEPPTANWLAKWLKDGKTTDIDELYRLFQQRVTGRAAHILRSDFGIDAANGFGEQQ